MPRQQIAFVVPFVMLHNPNCAQLIIQSHLCVVYYDLINFFIAYIILCHRFTVK